MTELEFRNRLSLMKARSTHLCGKAADGRALSVAVGEALQEIIDSDANPEQLSERKKLLAESEENGARRKQLCALRILQATNYIVGTQNIIPMFFHIDVLKEDERPVFQNNTKQQVKVGYTAQDGGNNEVKIVKPQVEVMLDLRLLTTNEIKYTKRDIYHGDVRANALQTVDLAFDMANQMEQVAFDLLTATVANGGAFGAFTFTGSKATYPYLANTRIKTANLPTTNDISLTDNTSTGPTSKFRFDVLKFAERYGDQWGQALGAGPLVPTGRVLVPALDATQLADAVNPLSAATTSVAEKLIQDGWKTIGYNGRNWTLVPDNTLSLGACYVEFNRKAGHAFLKPSMDRDRIDDTYETDLKNEERRWMQKVFGAYINGVERINVLRIIYNSAYDTAVP
jgi:hypothetical protein